MDSCLPGWIVVFSLLQLCWAQAPSTDSPVLQDTLPEIPSLDAVEEAVKAAFEQATQVTTDTVKEVLDQIAEVTAETAAKVAKDDIVEEIAEQVVQSDKELQSLDENETVEVTTEAEDQLTLVEQQVDDHLTPASVPEALEEDKQGLLEIEPAVGLEVEEETGVDEQLATAEGEVTQVTQVEVDQQEGGEVEVEVGGGGEAVEEPLIEVADETGEQAEETAGETTEEGTETQETEELVLAGSVAEAVGLEAITGDEDTAEEEVAEAEGGVIGEEVEEEVAAVAVVDQTAGEAEGAELEGKVEEVTEDVDGDADVGVALTAATDSSELNSEGVVVTESIGMVAPADNTLEQEVSKETNAVDMVIISHDDLLMVPEGEEDGPTLTVDSLEELPATPLEDGDETEEDEDEDDVEDADMNVLVDPPGPKEDTSLGHEAWKIGAIAAAFFLVLQTVVTIVYILKCRKRPSSSSPDRACEEGGASAESGPAENTDTTLPAEDGLPHQNAVSDGLDLTQAQQEVSMTDIKLNSESCEESSHDVRTSVL